MVAEGDGFPCLHDGALLHDQDAVAEVANQRHGMGDEQIREAVGALEVAEQVDDLCADGDIERADRLVENEEFRFEGEGAGDVDALTLASGEFVRKARKGGIVEADLGEQIAEARAVTRFVVDGEGLGEDLADGHAGVERGVGVLKDDLHAAAEGAEMAGGGVGNVGAVEVDRAAGGLDEAKHHAGDGAFAAAGFADDAEGLSAMDGEADVLDDGRFAVLPGEIFGDDERPGHMRMVAPGPEGEGSTAFAGWRW